MLNGFAEKKETFMAIKSLKNLPFPKGLTGGGVNPLFSRETRLTRTQIFGSVTQLINAW